MKPPNDFDDQLELFGREQALDLLAQYRTAAIAEAKSIRDELLDRDGKTTSVHVRSVMVERGWGPYFRWKDPRWLGTVFRSNEGLQECGRMRIGSHKRPVTVWARR